MEEGDQNLIVGAATAISTDGTVSKKKLLAFRIVERSKSNYLFALES